MTLTTVAGGDRGEGGAKKEGGGGSCIAVVVLTLQHQSYILIGVHNYLDI